MGLCASSCMRSAVPLLSHRRRTSVTPRHDHLLTLNRCACRPVLDAGPLGQATPSMAELLRKVVEARRVDAGGDSDSDSEWGG